jgi:anti-anti-sigma factor
MGSPRHLMAETSSLAVTVADGVATVTPSGELEMAATFTVEPAFERVVETPGLHLVTLDLSTVTFIDSVGLGVVMQLAGELENRGIAMRVVPGPPAVHRVFESVGMADALPFDHSRAA